MAVTASPSATRVTRKHHGTICKFFLPGNVGMAEKGVSQVVYCELDALQVAKTYLEMTEGRPMKSSEMV